jgi:transcriptional regulator with XRE-family HTH domain
MNSCIEIGIDIVLDCTKLRKLRDAERLSQQQVANDLCMTQAQIWRMENDENYNPTMRTMYAVANYFGVTIQEIIRVKKSQP